MNLQQITSRSLDPDDLHVVRTDADGTLAIALTRSPVGPIVFATADELEALALRLMEIAARARTELAGEIAAAESSGIDSAAAPLS